MLSEGLPWWSSGEDPILPLQGAMDSTCHVVQPKGQKKKKSMLNKMLRENYFQFGSLFSVNYKL